MFEFYAGCDTHKEKHCITIINLSGQIQESFEIENTLSGWKKAEVKSKKYSNLLWGIENSSNYAKKFSEYLVNSGGQAKEINPIFTGKRRKLHTNRNKTDEIDSLVIARILRDDAEYLPDILIDKQQDEIKSIIRQREELVKEKTRLVNRIHSKLTAINPMYKKLYGDLRTKRTLKSIKTEFIASNSIQEKLILQDIRLLENLILEIEELNNLLKSLKTELIDNLSTLNGINVINACKIFSLIGKSDKFKNSNHLASYAGIAPIEKSSGKTIKSFRNVGANRQLNTVFYQIALTQIRCDKEAKIYYEKKLTEGKTKKQALHCLMRRLIKIIWMMYKHNQPYNYQPKTNKPILQAA